MSFYKRYLDGEYERVWLELNSLGQITESNPIYQEAKLVAQETMKRVRHNIQLILPKLSEIGYVLEYEINAPFGQISAFSSSNQNDIECIKDFEKDIGSLPISLKAWYEEVGTVCLIGNYPEIWDNYQYLDPLTVWCAGYTLSCVDSKQMKNGLQEASISPDYYHKENTSGGSPYCALLPGATMDFKVLNEKHQTDFVSWLRTYFEFGGFIGFEKYANDLPIEVNYLCENLLKI